MFYLLQIFGEIKNPYSGIYNTPAGPLGLILFLNNVLKLITVVAGIFSFVQVLIAGFEFISAGGDAKKISSAWDKIWQAGLGLTIIASSFVLAAIFGWLMFGNPAAILNPIIYGPVPVPIPSIPAPK